MSRTTPPRLARFLVRLGSSATGRGPTERTRVVVLAAATAALTATVLGLVAILATFEGRDLREAQRQPQITDTAEQAVAWWGERPDSATREQHSVVYLDPADRDADPPPGLDGWPEPGEVHMSPALARAEPGIGERYGDPTGTIGPRGLLSPTERLAYVGLPDGATVPEDWMYPIRGFGPPGSYPFGENITITPAAPALMVASYVTLVLLPAGTLFVVAARYAARGRDRRAALLTALGAHARHQFLTGAASCLPAVLAGTAVGAAFAAPLLLTDTAVPGIDYTVRGGDLRRVWWAVPAAVAGSALTAVLGYATLHARRSQRGVTRPRPASDHVATWKLGVFALGTTLASGAALLPPGYWWTIPVYAVGLLCALALAPSALAAAFARLGSGIARRGARAGRPTWLVAGRWYHHRPGTLARLVAPVVIGVVTVVNIQYFAVSDTPMTVQAREANERVGGSALLVSAHELDERRVSEAVRELPDRARAAGLVTTSQDRGSTTLRAPCSVLSSLRLECATDPAPISSGAGGVRVTELLRWQVPDSARVRAGSTVPDGGQLDQLVALSPTEQPLSRSRVHTAVQPVLGPTTQVDELASFERSAANARLSEWGCCWEPTAWDCSPPPGWSARGRTSWRRGVSWHR